MKKYALFIFMLCLSSVLKAQTDTVAAKISKIPVVHVDVLAKFPGGDFTKYIAANIVYQRKSDRDMRGQVIISMKIDTNGKVSNVNVLKSVTPQIDQEVVHVIKSSPKWQPAMAKGKPIGVYMVFNIDMGMISAMASVAKSAPAVTAPEPVVKKPVIIASKIPPVPEKKAEPTPAVIEKKPALKAVKKPAPPYDKKPIPVEKKPLPQIAKKKLPPPPLAKKAEPLPVKKAPPTVVAKKTIPPPVKKAEPIVAKKPAPVIVKKPAPVVVKKTIEPIVKKTPPPVAKKPALVVAKKVTPAPAKKAKPVVAKKPVTPIAKITPPAPVVKKPTITPVQKPAPQVAKVILPPVVKKPMAAPAKPDEKKIATTAPVAKHKKPLTAKILKKVDEPYNGLGPSSEALFPDGGKPGFFKYLSDNIHYPILSKINKIEGEVNLSFVIDKDGTVSDVKVIDAPAEDLALEAKRVLLAAPKWKPAMQNGIPVKETFRVPVNFKIQDNKPSQQ